MITVYGTGRGVRVVWLLEEMGISYTMRPVDLLVGVENDPEFLEINPAGFIPAIRDGDVVMVESIAIMEYLLAKYGPSTLVPEVSDPAFPVYQQFLHLGEAGIATFVNIAVATKILAPPEEQENWGTMQALGNFERRMKLVRRRLEYTPFMAGDEFTAADISVSYALELARRGAGLEIGPLEKAYLERTTGRAAFARALEKCGEGTKRFYAARPED